VKRQIDPHIAKLLGAERARRGPPKAVRTRVRERVNASILLPAPPPTQAPHPSSGVPHAIPMVKAIAGVIGTMGPVARTVALVASVAVSGTAVGVLTARREPPEGPSMAESVAAPTRAEASGGGASSVPLTRRVEAPAVVPTPTATTLHAPATGVARPISPMAARAPMPQDTASVAAPSPPATSTAPPTGETLAAERSLLDEASGALRAGDAQAALRDLDLHGQRFPVGVLAEERDAMTVEALVAAGRADDARAAGARFRAAHSGSLLQPTVEDALRSIP